MYNIQTIKIGTVIIYVKILKSNVYLNRDWCLSSPACVISRVSPQFVNMGWPSARAFSAQVSFGPLALHCCHTLAMPIVFPLVKAS